MKLGNIAVTGLLAAALALPVFAQPAQGSGQGMGPGSGNGKGMGFKLNQDNTPGWTLMTADERAANQAKMRAAKSYDECKAVQEENHQAMAARAKEKGVNLPAPHKNGCDVMKARGFFK